MKIRTVFGALAALVGSVAAADGGVPALTLAHSNALLNFAATFAREHAAPGGTFAIVDAGGDVIAVARLDGTFAASAEIAIGKAHTAAVFQKSTGALEQTINGGRAALLALTSHHFTPLQGGVPIVIDGRFVGAVGVSGAASAAQDDEIAMATAAYVSQLK